MSKSQDIDVGRLRKNAQEYLVIRWRTHTDGACFLDIRIHARCTDGEMRPTGKGVTIRPGYIEQFVDMIGDAEDVARNRGILAKLPPEERMR